MNRRGLRTWALAGLLAGVSATHAAHAEDTGSLGPAGRILFTCQAQGQDDLFVLHLPEGRIERLTNHGSKDSHGAVSPDGRRIVFNSERQGWWKIWMMNADGSAIRQITHPTAADYFPTWSPDGQRIAFASGGQGNGDIVVINADGTGPRNLTENPARDNFPAWSPDGEEIAFASDRSGSWAIYRMKTDGSGVRPVTPEGDALEPAWHPSGNRIAYRLVQEDGESFDLWISDLRDNTASPITGSPFNDERPAYSPDGEWIVFESDRAGGSQLFLVSSAGGEVRQLTREGYCYGARWFPRRQP